MSADSHGFLPCPFCAVPVKMVDVMPQFEHAGSTHWGVTVFTKCPCFEERWTWSNYGDKESILAKAKSIWNCRKQ